MHMYKVKLVNIIKPGLLVSLPVAVSFVQLSVSIKCFALLYECSRKIHVHEHESCCYLYCRHTTFSSQSREIICAVYYTTEPLVSFILITVLAY